jgi:uncharacterized membrane protein
MFRIRPSWILLVSIVSCLVLAASLSVAQAKGPKKNPKLTWTPAKIVHTASPGQTTMLSVSFSSSVELHNITLAIPGDLAGVVTVAPASIARLQAGEVATVTLTIAVPAAGAHSQAGVLKVHQGKKSLPGSLKIKLTVPGSAEQDR